MLVCGVAADVVEIDADAAMEDGGAGPLKIGIVVLMVAAAILPDDTSEPIGPQIFRGPALVAVDDVTAGVTASPVTEFVPTLPPPSSE